jgi:hypothetical protein
MPQTPSCALESGAESAIYDGFSLQAFSYKMGCLFSRRHSNVSINVDNAMKAAGHSSVQMHKHYLACKITTLLIAFGTAPAQNYKAGCN